MMSKIITKICPFCKEPVTGSSSAIGSHCRWKHREEVMQRRKDAMEAIKNGTSVADTAAMLGIGIRVVYRWIKLEQFKNGDWGNYNPITHKCVNNEKISSNSPKFPDLDESIAQWTVIFAAAKKFIELEEKCAELRIQLSAITELEAKLRDYTARHS